MRGNIVLWPNYQDNPLTPTRQALPNALAGVKAGLRVLESGNYSIRPDLDRVVAAGHSAGGMVAAGIAARAVAEGLPRMKALMSVEPGDSQRGGVASVPLADLSTLPSDTLMLILVGQDDTSVGTFDGERILHESTSVSASDKALFMLHSDDHGSPALVANHYTPSAVLNSDGISPPKQSGERSAAEVCTSAARKTAGNPLRRAIGAEPLSEACLPYPRAAQELSGRALRAGTRALRNPRKHVA
jgi:hypothetical protein